MKQLNSLVIIILLLFGMTYYALRLEKVKEDLRLTNILLDLSYEANAPKHLHVRKHMKKKGD